MLRLCDEVEIAGLGHMGEGLEIGEDLHHVHLIFRLLTRGAGGDRQGLLPPGKTPVSLCLPETLLSALPCQETPGAGGEQR